MIYKNVNGKRVAMNDAEAARIQEEWAKPEIISTAQVKQEAERRILAIMPVYKQRNNIARGLELTGKYGADPTQWPDTDKTEYDAVIAQWKSIEAIRNKSNDLEKLKPIPEDYTDDKHW